MVHSTTVLYNIYNGYHTNSIVEFIFSINFPLELQPLESVSWLGDGVKFVSSHSNSSLNYWNLMSCTPSEGPVMHYGMCVYGKGYT